MIRGLIIKWASRNGIQIGKDFVNTSSACREFYLPQLLKKYEPYQIWLCKVAQC